MTTDSDEPEDVHVPTSDQYAFDYKKISLKDIQFEAKHHHELDEPAKHALRATGGYLPIHGGQLITKVLIDGESFLPSGRFWESLYSRFKLNSSIFKFFSHHEVLARVSEVDKNDTIRLTIERNKSTGDSRLLAATGLNKPVVIYDDLLDIMERFKADKGGVRYHNGTVVSTHTPRIGQSQFKIGGDKYSNRYELHCPVDGYGQPSIFLGLLRWVCSNGAVGFANAFQTTLALGSGQDNTRYTIERALDSFNNDEGYASLRGRFETASNSWASINEHQGLYKLILTLQGDMVLRDTIGQWDKANANDIALSPGNALMQTFSRTLGDPFKLYNNDPNLMSLKRRHSLPMSCRVYELINFATELATHYVSEANARQLQAWVGQMLTNDYDLEDSCDQFSNWHDLFFQDLRDQAAQVKGKPNPK